MPPRRILSLASLPALILAAACGGATGVPPATENAPLDDRLVEASRMAAEGDVEGALAIFRQVVEERPQDAQAHFRLGLALAESGDDEAAVLSLGKAVEIDPQITDAYLALGNSYLRMEDRRSAFLAFNEAAKVAPENASTWFNLGSLYYLGGSFEPAIRALRKARELRPDDPEIHFRIGMTEMNQGLLRDAIISFRVAVRQKPDHAEAWINLANVLTVEQQFDEAEQAVGRALELQPGWSDALNARGVLAQARDRDDEALRLFEEALAADPENARVHMNLGNLFEKRNEPRRAVEAYRKFLDAWRGDLGTAERVRERLRTLEGS